MQRHETLPASYEVWCNHCQTSFAAGTKRCIHCGQRLARQRRQRPVSTPRLDDHVERPPELDDLLGEEEDTSRRRSPLSPLTLVWIAILLGGYLFQLCAQR